eukprot:1666430-Pleurochrysis_carterae.AAC.1
MPPQTAPHKPTISNATANRLISKPFPTQAQTATSFAYDSEHSLDAILATTTATSTADEVQHHRPSSQS